MTQPPDAVLAVLRRHLATAAPPIDPVGHLATYHPAALLPVGHDLVRRDSLAAGDYAHGWKALGAIHGARIHGPAFTLAEVLDWQAGGQGGRLATRLQLTNGEVWTVAWLFAGPQPAIQAVCRLAGPLPDRNTLLAQAAADLAGWSALAAGALFPLSPVAIGWQRHRHQESLPLVSLPEARFTCQNRGDCCQVRKWQVPVSANTRTAIAAMPRESPPDQPWEMPQFQPADNGGWQIVADGDGACHAHADHGCAVHEALGWQPIPICQIFPIQATVTPDAIAVTASFTCLTVGDNVGAPLAEQADDLESRLAPWRHGLARVPKTLPLWPDGPTLSWEAYKSLEAALLDLLAAGDRGDLAARVRAASRGMAHLLATAETLGHCPTDPAAVVLAGLDLPLPGSAQTADALMGRLCGERPWPPVSLRPFGGWLRSQWSLSRLGTLGDGRDDELATRFLRTVLFRKPHLGTGGVAFTWGLIAWLAALWDRQTVYQSRHEQRPIDRTLQLDTARRLDHLLLHTPLLGRLAQDPAVRARLSAPATWLAWAAVSG
jgi:hypothetical protein